jgi:non-specific serine/threonine protein kinase
LDDNTHTSITLTKGSIVAQYRIEEKIGAGGMGEVYLAFDTKLDRRVALKFLPANLVSNEEIKSRFVREAKAAAKLHHPHIVTIFEVGEHNGRPFIAMEYVEGAILHQYAHGDTPPIATIIEYAVQLCQGLGEAHRAGIVHRDIKTRNIAVDKSGRTRILDFGLAAVQDGDHLTKTGSTLGTVSYMSPEQVSGREIDQRSDLFSLGVVLYELITARTPFKRENEGATLRAVMQEEPEPLARFRTNVPDDLQRIVTKLLEKDRELRYQTAEGVLADLKKLLYDSQQTGVSKSVARPKSKRLTTSLIAAAAIAVIALGAVYMGSLFRTTASREPVLIILPFENLGSPEDEYFSYGIREEIGSRLSMVDGLRVISQRSADKYKGTDKSAEQIGQEIGADFILEATIRWDRSSDIDRVRITPRLTKTSDNYLVWADNYEQQLVEIFAVQSKIADQIAVALGLTLVDTDKAAPEGTPTTNMAAYNYYLRGLEYSSQTFKMSDFHESIRMFDSAIALDSNFALAWAQKSINHSTFNFHFTSVDTRYHKTEALRAAEKALALDPGLPAAKIAEGTYHNYIERDYDQALASFNAAKSEMASNADLSQSIGIVKMRQGKWQEAQSLFEEAIRIDPLSDRRYFYISNCLAMIREYEAAENYIDRALVLDPTNADAGYIKLSLNLLNHGRLDYGQDSFDKLSTNVGMAEISTYELASSTALGLWRYIADKIDPDEAIANVRKLGEVRSVVTQRSPHMIHLNIGQIYDLTGHHDSALIHYDSSRIILKNIIDGGDPEFHEYSELGMTYALMGMKEEAIEAGQTAKEILPIEECHW